MRSIGGACIPAPRHGSDLSLPIHSNSGEARDGERFWFALRPSLGATRLRLAFALHRKLTHEFAVPGTRIRDYVPGRLIPPAVLQSIEGVQR